VTSENISIKANVACAFDIPNDMFLRGLDDHHLTWDEAVDWFSIQLLGRPEETATSTLYLAPDEASFVVGEVLTIDGGFTAQ